jgi:hypothetical protein
MEAGHYREALMEASRLLDKPPENLVSLKVRPTDDASMDIAPWQNSYVYPSDYAAIEAHLVAARLPIKDLGPVLQGRGFNIRLTSQTEVLFVEHESGPEIIFAWLAANKDGIDAVLSIANILKIIFDVISASVKVKRDGAATERYYDASFAKIEARTVKGATVLQNKSLPYDIANEAPDLIHRVNEATL